MNNNGDLQTGRNREKYRLYAIVLSRRETLSQFFEKNPLVSEKNIRVSEKFLPRKLQFIREKTGVLCGEN